ncbi:hypothetical protein [Salmonella phage vB_SenS_SB15]|uniref:Uncharacterized protein n=1 Tax=Salmonella phage vB_SenS_SB15 TaxID=2698416 RepID=A0A6B9RN48_9CAUD|nr:hypothetical protein [Salmonella phage vB_SenS_SB15]
MPKDSWSTTQGLTHLPYGKRLPDEGRERRIKRHMCNPV